MESRLQAAEMWFLRKVQKIQWTQTMSNAEVLHRAGINRELMWTAITRQIRFVGHVLRKESLENLVLTGKVDGQRARGRQRLAFLGWLERATGI